MARLIHTTWLLPCVNRDLATNGHCLSLLFTKSCPAFPSREVRATPVQLRFSRSPPPFAGTASDPDYSTTAQWRCADTLRPALGSISTWRHIRAFERPDKSTLGANVGISICSILNRCCLANSILNILLPLLTGSNRSANADQIFQCCDR